MSGSRASLECQNCRHNPELPDHFIAVTKEQVERIRKGQPVDGSFVMNR